MSGHEVCSLGALCTAGLDGASLSMPAIESYDDASCYVEVGQKVLLDCFVPEIVPQEAGHVLMGLLKVNIIHFFL